MTCIHKIETSDQSEFNPSITGICIGSITSIYVDKSCWRKTNK